MALCGALCPRTALRLDEAVAGALHAKHRDALGALGRPDGAEFLRDRFVYACPRFLDVQAASGGAGQGGNDRALGRQMDAFLAEVDRRRQVPALKQYLSLYTASHMGETRRSLAVLFPVSPLIRPVLIPRFGDPNGAQRRVLRRRAQPPRPAGFMTGATSTLEIR